MCKIEKTNEEGVSSIDHNHKQYKRKDTPMREKPLINLKLSDLWKGTLVKRIVSVHKIFSQTFASIHIKQI